MRRADQAQRLSRFIARTVVAGTATLAVMSLLLPMGGIGWAGFICAGVALSERYRARRRVGSQGWDWSPADAFLAFGLVVSPGFALLVAMTVGLWLSQWGRTSAEKQRFNVAQTAVAVGVSLLALITLTATVDPFVAASLALVTYFLVNNGLVIRVLSLASGTSVGRLVAMNVTQVAVASMAAGAIGFAAAAVLHRPALAASLLLPIAVTAYGYSASIRNAERERGLRRLHELVGVSDRTEADVMTALTTAASEILEPVEISVISEVDELSIAWDVDADGRPVFHLTGPEEAVALAEADMGEVRQVTLDGHSAIIAVLPDDEARTVLVVRSTDPHIRLTRSDREFVRTLALAAAGALRAARRAELEATARHALSSLVDDRGRLREQLGRLVAATNRAEQSARSAAPEGLALQLRTIRSLAEDALFSTPGDGRADSITVSALSPGQSELAAELRRLA